MVDDPRYRTKVWLETYILNANLTKDDDATQVTFIVCYGMPNYPIERVFKDKNVDLVFSITKPDSTPIFDSTHYVIGYSEEVPITTFTVDKTGITGTKLNWKAETELRRISENNPLGSLRQFKKLSDSEQNLGSTILYSSLYQLNYERDKT